MEEAEEEEEEEEEGEEEKEEGKEKWRDGGKGMSTKVCPVPALDSPALSVDVLPSPLQGLGPPFPIPSQY
ncbi:hypothetical protein ACG7TL_004522 [Trametes sanguinea]